MAWKTGAWGKEARERSKKRLEYFKKYQRDHFPYVPKNPSYHYQKLPKKVLVKDLRIEALKKLGGKCVKCGFDDWRALQIDHVNGGGKKDLEKLKHRYTFYRKILRGGIEGYQILCANCNWIKRYEKKEIGNQFFNYLNN